MAIKLINLIEPIVRNEKLVKILSLIESKPAVVDIFKLNNGNSLYKPLFTDSESLQKISLKSSVYSDVRLENDKKNQQSLQMHYHCLLKNLEAKSLV